MTDDDNYNDQPGWESPSHRDDIRGRLEGRRNARGDPREYLDQRRTAAQGRVDDARGRYGEWRSQYPDAPEHGWRQEGRDRARGRYEDWQSNRPEPPEDSRRQQARGRYDEWRGQYPDAPEEGYRQAGRDRLQGRADEARGRYGEWQSNRPEHPAHRPPWQGRPKPNWPPDLTDPNWGIDAPLDTPEHPIHIPGSPEGSLPEAPGHDLPPIDGHQPPPDMPPGTIWPPLPPDAPTGKHAFLVWISGVGLRYGVFDIPPHEEGGEEGGEGTQPGQLPGGRQPPGSRPGQLPAGQQRPGQPSRAGVPGQLPAGQSRPPVGASTPTPKS
jgi:hypothetical protein